MDEEQIIAWQDVLDEIAAGRTGQLACPYCHHRPLAVEADGQRTRISCSQCKRFIEGSFAAQQ